MSEEENVEERALKIEEHNVLSTESSTCKPTKLTLNKNGKPRKQLSPEALERLAKAREKANAIRKQQTVKKLEEKVEKLNIETQNTLGEMKCPQKHNVEENTLYNIKDEETLINEEKPKPKPKGKKKTKIIVEQSSEDSDEFEANDNVVFVKRVSRKKKDITPAVQCEPPQREPPQREPEMPPRPEPQCKQITPEQRVLKSQYENMFSGGFMNNNNLMRRHY